MGKKSTAKRIKGANMDGKVQLNTGDLPRRRAANYMEGYANHCEITRTPYDFNMRFLRLSTAIEKGKTIAEMEEQCAVYLTISQAKAFQLLLKRQLDEYEAELNKIHPEKK